jgi:hypothetical protein
LKHERTRRFAHEGDEDRIINQYNIGGNFISASVGGSKNVGIGGESVDQDVDQFRDG